MNTSEADAQILIWNPETHEEGKDPSRDFS
jgi:hypothetical protein